MRNRGPITRKQAWAILNYHYSVGTIADDPEWAEEMVDMMVESRMEARRYCEAHGMTYPPKEWWDMWFDVEQEGAKVDV